MEIGFTVFDVFARAIELGASDIHFSPGYHPIVRVHGKLDLLTDFPILTSEMLEKLLIEDLIIGHPSLEASINKYNSADFAVSMPDNSRRFRANVFRQVKGWAGVFRMLASSAPRLENLGIPRNTLFYLMDNVLRKTQGLLLVTGPTGSGKSTTLAAIINYLLDGDEPVHVITVEDPIEYQFSHHRSIINQREVGKDTPNFAHALRDALREDPDIIMVGEMRDLETIKIALTAAETGHLVLATLHTNSAPQTITRIVDSFPPEQQNQIRLQLSTTLLGVLSQRLPRTVDGKRTLALEAMFVTPAISALIRDNKIKQISTMIEQGREKGMITMERHLEELVEEGMITHEEAMKYMPEKV
jgi:twitching motility protein PilT